MDYEASQIKDLPDAVLVSFYRCLLVGRKKLAEDSKLRLLETCQAEIKTRGIDLDNFRGDTGFTS